MLKRCVFIFFFAFITLIGTTVYAQTRLLTIQDAVNNALEKYQSIQAKKSYIKASQSLIQNAKNEYLPNVIAGIQNSYGTVNGQFGPLGAVGVLGVASAGPASEHQSWNAAFGSLYIVNANWEAFTFGRVRSRIDLAVSQSQKDSADLAQEEFIHSVKVSSAYMNLLLAQRLQRAAESNLGRALTVQQLVRARVNSGLNPGVDTSLTNAEVSRARLALTDVRNTIQQNANLLAQYLNVAPEDFRLDTALLDKIPSRFDSNGSIEQNPQIRYYQSRINQSGLAAKAISKNALPSINLFAVYQMRGSGFDYNYSPQFPDRYSTGYFDGLNPTRMNYVAGISVTWNLMSPWKVRYQSRAQGFITDAYQREYDQILTQLTDQSVFADQRIQNTLEAAREVPIQLKAAADAYLQKSVLFKNGLTTVVDLQQALYGVNRAEADMSVANINVWQSLLVKAAASGDMNLFLDQAK